MEMPPICGNVTMCGKIVKLLLTSKGCFKMSLKEGRQGSDGRSK